MKYKGLNVPSGATHYMPESTDYHEAFFKKRGDNWYTYHDERLVRSNRILVVIDLEELPPPCPRCQGIGTTQMNGLPGEFGACIATCYGCGGTGINTFLQSVSMGLQDWTPDVPDPYIPEVGEECEWHIGSISRTGTYVGVSSRGSHVVEIEGEFKSYYAVQIEFHPLKTVREKTHDAALKILGSICEEDTPSLSDSILELYDAGMLALPKDK